MTVLEVGRLRFGYGANTLFEEVSFSLALGDRVGLVAPNGSGKSTLLRLMAGELEPDSGSVVRRNEASLGYYRQSHEHVPEGTVLEAFLSEFRAIVELRSQLRKAEERASSGTKEALSDLARLQDAYHLARGDALERRVAELATKLGFADCDLARPVVSLSGGERGRLRLGTILATDSSLLLLDEPTNHLDLDTIDWLEHYLRGLRAAVMVVSHDRAFLDVVTNKTIELGRQRARIYPLPYSDYIVAREEDLAREESIVQRQQEFISKTEDFIRRNIAGQKTKQAQSRRKMLEKLERAERPEDVWAGAERMAFRFAPALRSGDIVFEAKGVSAERGGRQLFSGVDLLVRRGERVAIVGPNGSGKSTLLKILAGVGSKEDRGAVRRGTNLQDGYFDQHLGELDASLSSVEQLRLVRGDLTVESARQYLARFRFYGDDPLRTISTFSGGERSRLALAKLLLEPRNVLFLDEPTNHLDIPAAEILEEALVSFEGTVLFISHDRRFLENVSTRVVTLRDGRCEVTMTSFRDLQAPPPILDDEASVAAVEIKREPVQEGAGRISFETGKLQRREFERKKRRIGELEAAIAKAEVELVCLRDDLKGHPADDWEKLADLAEQERSLSSRVEEMMAEWAKLSDEVGT